VATPTLARPTPTGSTPTRSSRRLSEVTKKLAYPKSRIASSEWSHISNVICREQMGIEFDGWQNGLGQMLLAKDADGILVHTVGGLHLSVCRQAGKTYFYAGALFGLSVKYDGLLTIWSAHHSRTHDETFEAMQGFVARTKVRPFIKRVLTGSGTEAIEFTNGSRILFGARERGFGRGVPGVDILMSDEAQILSERAMQNMLATMNTSALGLHIYAGTPPKPEDNSEQWLRSRAEAWVDGPDGPPIVDLEDMAWVEIGADNGCDLDDREQWAKANPSFPHRTPVQAFMRLRRKLNEDGFRREGLGLYDEDSESDFNISRWEQLVVDAEQPSRAVLVLDSSPDNRWSSIGVASDLPRDSDADPERTLVMVKSFPGTDGVVKAVEKMRETHDIVEVAITGSGKVFETELTQAMIEFETLSQSEMATAYGNLQKAIKHGTVAHIGQPEVAFALANAKSGSCRPVRCGRSTAAKTRWTPPSTSAPPSQ
jgi:hypothetical protein